MSYKTWAAEYYPKPAREAIGTPLEAAKHSLQKWIGLRKENMEKHGVLRRITASGSNIVIGDLLWRGNDLVISWESCALCRYAGSYYITASCSGCPLYEVRGQIPCCEASGSAINAFFAYTRRGDPEPMIEDLQATVRMLEKTQ
jgi:hypothetical protein